MSKKKLKKAETGIMKQPVRSSVKKLSKESSELYYKTASEIVALTNSPMTEEEIHQLAWLSVLVAEYDFKTLGIRPSKRVEVEEAETVRKCREFLVGRLGELRKESSKTSSPLQKLKEEIVDGGGQYSEVFEMKIGDTEKKVTRTVDVPRDIVEVAAVDNERGEDASG